MACAHAFGEVCEDCAQTTVDRLQGQQLKLVLELDALKEAVAEMASAGCDYGLNCGDCYPCMSRLALEADAPKDPQP